jgi:D-alanyl-D-alanine endopeptidase (penicillin-binding protein 7)
MNPKAKSLGMTQTHFENPTGLSKLNVSSAPDLVKMVNAAYQYPLIRKFSTAPGHKVGTGIGVLSWRNTNILISNSSWDMGLQKTGFVNESGIYLVTQPTVWGYPVVMVLLDSVGRHSDFADAGRLRAFLTSHVQRSAATDTANGGS